MDPSPFSRVSDEDRGIFSCRCWKFASSLGLIFLLTGIDFSIYKSGLVQVFFVNLGVFCFILAMVCHSKQQDEEYRSNVRSKQKHNVEFFSNVC
jgi:hypothetical protein